MASKTIVKTKSPKGEFIWMFVNGKGKKQMQNPGENKPNKFEASVRFKNDDPLLLGYIKEVKQFWKDAKPKGKALKSFAIKEEYIKDEDGEKQMTGYSLITFKTNIAWPDGKPVIVRIYNAAGTNITKAFNERKIANESIGRLYGKMDIYNLDTGAGVALYLTGVQLTKFIEYEGDTDDVEVDDEDGGFDGSEFNEDDVIAEASETPKIDLGEDDDTPF